VRAGRWAFPSRGRDKPNASAARYGAGDLSQLSVPSGQLRALAFRTAATMLRVPAALGGGDGELGPSARHGSLRQYLVHLCSDLLTLWLCWAEC
jgi:hypothetical protein